MSMTEAKTHENEYVLMTFGFEARPDLGRSRSQLAAWLCSPGLRSSRSQRAIPLDAARSLRRRRRRQLALFFVVSVVQRRLSKES